MANPQATETIDNELLGAVSIEVSTNGSSWVDVGAVNSAVLTENMTVSTVETQNAVDRDLITDQTGTLSFDRLEMWKSDVSDIIRSGIDTKETIAASTVSGATQVVASGSWGYNDPFIIENQNGDETQLTINSVTGGTDSLLVADTDYFIGQDENGLTIITVIDSATVSTLSQTMTVDYDYTPSATTRYYTGGFQDFTKFYLRVSNTETINSISTTTRWTTYDNCNLASGEETTFKKYNDGDPRVAVPTTISIKQDITKDIGKRLWYKDRIIN